MDFEKSQHDAKSLKEMSLDELWQLFPIELSGFDPEWSVLAREEIENLQHLLHMFNPIINHIGSTSIIGIMSKPIVDILIETPDADGWNKIITILETNGYLLMSQTGDRMSFNKGYSPTGYEKSVFHIHFHLSGDNDEIIFRDFLNANPIKALEYEKLKRSLLPKFKHDRDGYTSAKSAFIRDIIHISKTGSLFSDYSENITESLTQKINKQDVNNIAQYAAASIDHLNLLWKLSLSDNRKISVNSLWVMTHLGSPAHAWLRTIQPLLIARLLTEEDTSKKRLYLQLLREQELDDDSSLTSRLVDWCFTKINSESEPYAIRCSGIYVAFKICRRYPELIRELEEYLNLLSTQSLSPGLQSALRQTRTKISGLKFLI